MHASRIRLECLKLAVEMCKTASAFDRPDRVMELTKQFEDYCCGAPDPGRQMLGDPPPDPPAGGKRNPSKAELARLLK